MKKKTLLILVTLLICFGVVANGLPEQQLLMNLSPALQNVLSQIPQVQDTTDQTQDQEGDEVSSAYKANQSNKITKKVSVNTNSTRTTMGTVNIDSEMTSLTRLYNYIDKNYLYDIDYTKVYEAMAAAMFQALDDEYSMFVKTEETDDYDLSMTRKYAGAGFVFSKYSPEYQDSEDLSTLYCVLSQVYPGTPAAKAGLKAKDMVTHVDGESVTGLTSTECADRIKGDPGTTVVLTILRNGSSFDVTITREIITIPEISYCMLDDGVGYLCILQFISDTADNVKDALVDMQNQGMKSLIIDLRDNPGGLVDVTLQIADMFLPAGKVLMRTSYVSTTEVDYSSANQVVSDDVKVAILVNSGSASSSEILTATLKDNGRATVIGETTFGKGISQTVGNWGNNEFKLTTATFLTPNGDVIHKVGIAPDIEVEYPSLTEEEYEEYANCDVSSLIKSYVEENPDYTKKNVTGFAKHNSQINIRTEILNMLVSSEYISQMPTDDQPAADFWFDPQILAAVEYLTE